MNPVKTDAPKSGSHHPAIPALNPPGPTRQATFYQLLVAARKQWFIDALNDALRSLDQTVVKQEISRYAPADVQQILAASGLRDEYVFPVPVVLEATTMWFDATEVLGRSGKDWNKFQEHLAGAVGIPLHQGLRNYQSREP